MIRRPKLVALRFTPEELAELDGVLGRMEDRSRFIRAAVREKIASRKAPAEKSPPEGLDTRAIGDNEIIRMPKRVHTNASGQTFPGAPYDRPAPIAKTATAKARPKKQPKKCRHGAEEGYNCGLCGGLAVME
jgi:hypothetical protein